jgi:hypothetical protein
MTREAIEVCVHPRCAGRIEHGNGHTLAQTRKCRTTYSAREGQEEAFNRCPWSCWLPVPRPTPPRPAFSLYYKFMKSFQDKF